MKQEFTVNLMTLRAANVCVSKEETRYYLKGVCLQGDASGLYMVATDGHRLVAFRDDTLSFETRFEVIIPTDTIAKIKVNKKAPQATITIEENNGKKQVTIDYLDAKMTVQAIDGTFPDWRRVVPATVSGQIGQFNPTYLADFVKVMRELDCDNKLISIGHNGNDAAIIGLDIDFDYVALIMPVRAVAPNQAPSWVKPQISVAA